VRVRKLRLPARKDKMKNSMEEKEIQEKIDELIKYMETTPDITLKLKVGELLLLIDENYIHKTTRVLADKKKKSGGTINDGAMAKAPSSDRFMG
jgi:hypothetical protein